MPPPPREERLSDDGSAAIEFAWAGKFGPSSRRGRLVASECEMFRTGGEAALRRSPETGIVMEDVAPVGERR